MGARGIGMAWDVGVFMAGFEAHQGGTAAVQPVNEAASARGRGEATPDVVGHGLWRPWPTTSGVASPRPRADAASLTGWTAAVPPWCASNPAMNTPTSHAIPMPRAPISRH